MANIKEVAALAGVSIASVSRYFNNASLLAPGTAEKIGKAVKELDFTPSQFGSSLRTLRSGKILIILPTASNPMYQKIIRAIDGECTQIGMQTMICIGDNNAYRERELLAMLASHSADGAIMFSSALGVEELDEIGKRYPLVQCCEVIHNTCHVPSVTVDNEAAAYEVGRHFVEMGHRRMAVIAGAKRYECTQSRVSGFVRAMREAGIEWNDANVLYSDYGYGSGQRAASELFAKQDRPTAIFAFSDALAIGALSQARKQGLEPGRDVAVCGFDDTGIAMYYEPALSSVHQPREQMGKCAFELLKKKIDRKTDCKSIILEHKLELRASSNFQYKGE